MDPGDSETAMKLFNFHQDETYASIHTSQQHMDAPRSATHRTGTSESKRVSEFDFECSHGGAVCATVLLSFSHLLWNGTRVRVLGLRDSV